MSYKCSLRLDNEKKSFPDFETINLQRNSKKYGFTNNFPLKLLLQLYYKNVSSAIKRVKRWEHVAASMIDDLTYEVALPICCNGCNSLTAAFVELFSSKYTTSL